MTKTKMSVRVKVLTPELNAEILAEQKNYQKMKYNRRMERALEDKRAEEAHREVVLGIKTRYFKALEKTVADAVAVTPEITKP